MQYLSQTVLTVSILLLMIWNSYSEETTMYPDIPRIDVHTHIAENLNAIANY